MNFSLGETADMLRRTVQDFAQDKIAPRAAAIDQNNQFPNELWPEMGRLGLLGITVAPEFGGSGMGYTEHIVAMEEISRASASVGLSYGAFSNLCVNQISLNGTTAQKKKYLPDLCAGKSIGALAMSEAGSGSDVVSMKLRADKKGARYVLNGTKMWITNGMQNDWICLLANTSEGAPHKNKSMIIVPMDTKGVHRALKIDKIGMNSSDTAQIFFDDVRVPQRYLVGQEGMGFTMQMKQFQEERMFGSAMGLKGMELAIQSTIEYTRERKAFGQSLLDNQVIHFRLAELQTEIEALRALVYRTASLYAENHDSPEVVKLASMCKLKVGRLAREVTDSCLQYWGGMGFSSESIVSRLYRDFRLTSIGGGADEVMIGIICKVMGTAPGRQKG